MFFQDLIKGVDWWIVGTLILLLVVIGIVVLLNDLKEIRAQQELIRDQEKYYVTQNDISRLLAHNNKVMLTRIYDVIKTSNEMTANDSGEAVPVPYVMLEEQLLQSIQAMEQPFGHPTKEQQLLSDAVHESGPALV